MSVFFNAAGFFPTYQLLLLLLFLLLIIFVLLLLFVFLVLFIG